METPEIRLEILRHCSLNALVALSQTCTDFRALMPLLDDTLVRPKVLKRVPWMTVAPGAGLKSWMDCARLIVARYKSRTQEPEQWCTTDSQHVYDMDDLANTADIEYIDGVCVDGEALPKSFDPLFESADFPVPYGLARGKYLMSIRDDGITLDMTTMEHVPENPDQFPFKLPDPADVWIAMEDFVSVRDGSKWVFRCANSYITIISQAMFCVRQESERWIVIEDETEHDAEEDNVYIIDKQKAVNNTLLFDRHNCVSHYPRGYMKDYTFHLLPGSQGAFRVKFDLTVRKLFIYYLDLTNGEPEILVMELNGSDQLIYERGHAFDPMPDLFLIYRGMLYYNHYQHVLIPLWVDLEAVPSTGNKYSWRSLSMASISHDFHKSPVELDRSEDGRWVTQAWSERRIVCDLLRFKTYIVRDYGWQKDPWKVSGEYHEEVKEIGCIFVGADRTAEKPVFYVINRPYLFAMDLILHKREKLEPDVFLHRVSKLVYNLFFEGSKQLQKSAGYYAEAVYEHIDQVPWLKGEPLNAVDEQQEALKMKYALTEEVYKRPLPMTRTQAKKS